MSYKSNKTPTGTMFKTGDHSRNVGGGAEIINCNYIENKHSSKIESF